MKKTAMQLVEEANKVVSVVNAEEALKNVREESAILVDIRDIRELAKLGRIKDAIHTPRGLLEFWFDPESPYHKEVFADDSKVYTLFCAAGARSALAAKSLVDMGFENIAHVSGGFAALKDAGAPSEDIEKSEN